MLAKLTTFEFRLLVKYVSERIHLRGYAEGDVSPQWLRSQILLQMDYVLNDIEIRITQEEKSRVIDEVENNI